jgi:hypothetical protein
MRKRSKYRPKPQYKNPVDSVIERLTPVRDHGAYLADLRIRNHQAMHALVRGTATVAEIGDLVGICNVAEGLLKTRAIGAGHEDRVNDGVAAMKAVCVRHRRDGRVTLYAAEIEALNALLELADAQLECITVDDMDKVLKYVIAEQRAGRTDRITSAVL